MGRLQRIGRLRSLSATGKIDATPAESQQVRDAVRKLLMRGRWGTTLAVTLTLRQYLHHQIVTTIDASSSFRHFKNRLESYSRSKGIRVIAVCEYSEDKRLHIHAAIEVPVKANTNEFIFHIGMAWGKVLWARHVCCIREVYSDGWQTYILKQSTKPEFSSCILWESVHNPIT